MRAGEGWDHFNPVMLVMSPTFLNGRGACESEVNVSELMISSRDSTCKRIQGSEAVRSAFHYLQTAEDSFELSPNSERFYYAERLSMETKDNVRVVWNRQADR